MGQDPWLKRNSLELQFWGYESGNVIASITGAGGFAAFWASLSAAIASRPGDPLGIVAWLATQHPETFATLGVIVMVAAAYPLSQLARRAFGDRAASAVNMLAVPIAIALLGYAVVAATNFFTVAACAFVLASCLLRGAGQFPVLLKLGGLLLALGGSFLALAGLGALAGNLFGVGVAPNVLAVLTLLTGYYVAGAGLLTYRGGCFAISDETAPRDGVLGTNGRWIAQPLARHLDPLIDGVINNVVTPSLFWVSSGIRENYPFWTSMLARLPWRVATGLLALATGTAAGQCFAIANVLWAIGDVAIGALDYQSESQEANDAERAPN